MKIETKSNRSFLLLVIYCLMRLTDKREMWRFCFYILLCCEGVQKVINQTPKTVSMHFKHRNKRQWKHDARKSAFDKVWSVIFCIFFAHIYHCFPKKHLGLLRGITIVQFLLYLFKLTHKQHTQNWGPTAPRWSGNMVGCWNNRFRPWTMPPAQKTIGTIVF